MSVLLAMASLLLQLHLASQEMEFRVMRTRMLVRRAIRMNTSALTMESVEKTLPEYHPLCPTMQTMMESHL